MNDSFYTNKIEEALQLLSLQIELLEKQNGLIEDLTKRLEKLEENKK